MATDDAKRLYLRESVEAQLTFIWDEHEVTLEVQYNVGLVYKTLRLFSTIADDRTSMRDAMKTDFGLDPTAGGIAGPHNRAMAGAMIASWEVARDLLSREAQMRVEAKAHDIPRKLQANEKLAMRRIAERTAGEIPNNEFPHGDYLAAKLEEVENDEVSASPLDEMASVNDTETQTLSSAIDASGRICVSRTKNKVKMPANSEELRLRLRVEFHTWLLISTKHVNKPYLQGLDARAWERYADYLLGDKVNSMMVPVAGSDLMQQLHPPWSVVLHYEYELRKFAFKMIRDNLRNVTIMQALQLAMKDPELKEVHFTSPIALQGRGKSSRNFHDDPPLVKVQRVWEDKGKGRGRGDKGKGKKGDKGKGKGRGRGSRGGSMLTHTPDGRQICFAYNSSGGCHEPCQWGRIHVCRKKGCMGNHSFIACPQAGGKN